MRPSVVIDCLPSSVARYQSGYAIVAIDVIRATTMAITAVALGRRCFVADTVEAALSISSRLSQPLLAGELGGHVPLGFEMNNSPAELSESDELNRPLVLLSSSGTQLVCNAARCAEAAYVACFRNFTAVARHLAGLHSHIAVIGAGSKAEFREEDQMCCAWIAEQLINSGYAAENAATMKFVERWSGASPSACRISNSVAYLRRSQQLRDLDFILAHIDDLNEPYAVKEDEVIALAVAKHAESGSQAA